jgi:hypothetical protein
MLSKQRIDWLLWILPDCSWWRVEDPSGVPASLRPTKVLELAVPRRIRSLRRRVLGMATR